MSFAQPFSNYEILERLGAGAMGTVFKARQKHMNRIVALKVLKPSLARDERYVERLRREARIVGQLNHPNIVTGYDLGQEGGYHFFVMEYVEGRSLRQLLQEWGHFPEEQVLDVALQVTNALAHAYECGVIHRDIKPANVLIDDDGRVKLTDMGLAKGTTDLTLTRDGATVGTPQYISPEQARDPHAVDVRGDLYSLGATLFHMATGQAPFKAETIGELIHKVLHERADSVHGLNPAISEGLSLVIRKLLAKNPDLRYQTPQELLEDLRRVQRQERPQIDPRALDAVRTRPAGRRSPRVFAGALAGLAVVLLTVWFGWLGDDAGHDVGIDPADPARVAALGAELDALDGFQERLRAIDEQRDRFRDPVWERRLEHERRRVLHEMRRAAEGVVDRYLDESGERSAIARWLAEPEHWSDPGSFVGVRLAQEFRRALGCGPEDLPDGVRDAVEERVAQLEAVIARLREVRDQAHAADHRRYLQEALAGPVRAEIQRGAFAAARLLLEAPDRFHGRDGRPRLDQLPPLLRDRVTAEAERQRTELADAIGVAQSSTANEIGRHARERLDHLQLLRDRIAADGRDPDVLREAIDHLAADLRDRFPGPEAFKGGGADPWEEIEARIATLRDGVRALQRIWDGAVLDSWLDTTWRVFVTDGAAGARHVIDLEPVRPWHPTVREEHARHLALLEAVERYVAALLDDRSGGRSDVVVSVQLGSGRTDYVLRRDARDAWTVLRREGDREHPLGPCEIDWPALARQASARLHDAIAADPDLELGRAVLALACGAIPSALSGLDAGQRDFLQTEVLPRLEVARLRHFDDARRAFLRVVGARQDGDVAAARRELRAFDEAFGGTQFAAHNREARAEIEAWLERHAARERRLAELSARKPPGAELVEGPDGSFAFVLPLAKLPAELPAGWQRVDDHVVRCAAPADSNLARQALRLGSPLDVDADVEVALDVRFLEQGQEPRLLGIELHGAVVVLAVLPSGSVAAGIVPALGDVGDPAALGQRGLGAALAATLTGGGPDIVFGAWHRIDVRVTRGRQTVAVQVLLDGRPLLRTTRHRRDAQEAGIALLSDGPVALRGVRLRSLDP